MKKKISDFLVAHFFHPFFGAWESAAAVAASEIRTIGSQNANKQIIHISSIDWRGGKAKFDIRDRLDGPEGGRREVVDESAGRDAAARVQGLRSRHHPPISIGFPHRFRFDSQ